MISLLRHREQRARREYCPVAAYHEAAHVVAAIALGLIVDEVFIGEALSGGGVTRFQPGRRVEDQIMVMLAPWEDRRLKFGGSDDHPTNHDYRDALGAAMRLTQDAARAEKMLLKMSERVRGILSTRRDEIDEVADALLEHGYLDAEDLASLHRPKPWPSLRTFLPRGG